MWEEFVLSFPETYGNFQFEERVREIWKGNEKHIDYRIGGWVVGYILKDYN